MVRLEPDTAGWPVRRPVTRFAPSPTGYLHLGHVVNALYVWGMAQALGGSVLVRMEDHDRLRCRDEFDAAILADLAWLGLLDDPATSPGMQRQSRRTRLYEETLRQLRASAHVYACDCSRSRIGGERYDGHCRERGIPAARAGTGLRVRLEPGIERFRDLRLGTVEQDPAAQCGDLLIRDRDGHWTYQFAVTVDDLDQGVTLVVRGEDLLSSTGRQIRLARMLRTAAGLSSACTPPMYLHHPLIHGGDGRKLSKSEGAAGVRGLRDAGVSPGEVIGRAAAAAGLLETPRPVAPAQLGALLRSRAQVQTAQRDDASALDSAAGVGG